MYVFVLFLFIICRMTLVYWVDVVVCLVFFFFVCHFLAYFQIVMLFMRYGCCSCFCFFPAAKRTASYTHFNSTCQPCYLTNCVTLTCSNKLDNNNSNNNNNNKIYNDKYYEHTYQSLLSYLFALFGQFIYNVPRFTKVNKNLKAFFEKISTFLQRIVVKI